MDQLLLVLTSFSTWVVNLIFLSLCCISTIAYTYHTVLFLKELKRAIIITLNAMFVRCVTIYRFYDFCHCLIPLAIFAPGAYLSSYLVFNAYRFPFEFKTQTVFGAAIIYGIIFLWDCAKMTRSYKSED
ncbi:hypothetical protein GH810_03510 [Acetobacterium paludosum]|uniref:Uncharacterized protein n=1 Tax=Acetobacterium paludosum TaxID=52693 RepID=A0A923KVD7_9FIRM|nr:hypothetical protein [Acetobacterium paludosum]MBC3887375.1 hypothetical protein [Acetobacterium paludosum]